MPPAAELAERALRPLSARFSWPGFSWPGFSWAGQLVCLMSEPVMTPFCTV